MNVEIERSSAEMTLTLLRSRIKELLEMEEQHTTDRADTWKDIPNWTCGCSSQVIDLYMSAHNAIVRASSETCIDCSLGETCGRHMTINTRQDVLL